MDLVKIETEVMQIGAWKSYDELESNLTLEELYELYQGILYTRIEEFKNMARAQGAKFEDEDEDTGGGEVQKATNFSDIIKQVNQRRAGDTGEEVEDKRTVGIFTINKV